MTSTIITANTIPTNYFAHAKPIIVLMGVCGSGKSTVAQHLVDHYGMKYAEADDFHPQANIDKMAAGHPLTDEDRWPWLDTIAAWIDERVAAGEPAVVTCSALKKIYRDKLRRQGVTKFTSTYTSARPIPNTRPWPWPVPSACEPSLGSPLVSSRQLPSPEGSQMKLAVYI